MHNVLGRHSAGADERGHLDRVEGVGLGKVRFAQRNGRVGLKDGWELRPRLERHVHAMLQNRRWEALRRVRRHGRDHGRRREDVHCGAIPKRTVEGHPHLPPQPNLGRRQ